MIRTDRGAGREARAIVVAGILGAIAAAGCGSGGPSMPSDFDPSKYKFNAASPAPADTSRGLRSTDGPGVAGLDQP